ncbi:MAG: hypothetical protein WCD53_16840 [Microcoleus sp.]
MGRSPSIEELQQQEDNFRKYIEKLEAELKGRSDNYRSKMDEDIKDFYAKNGWKEENYISGTNVQFLHTKEWTMDNVKKFIENVGISLLGGGTPPPQGVTITPPSGMSEATGEIAKWQQFVVGRVFTVVDNILTSFGASSSVEFKFESRDIGLGNGLHLFITLVTDSYQSTSFFNNEYIHEYIYMYEVKYSAGEAKQVANLQLTDLYENQIVRFTKLVEKLLADLGDGTITPEIYQSKTEIYTELIEKSKKALEGLEHTLKANHADFMLAENK